MHALRPTLYEMQRTTCSARHMTNGAGEKAADVEDMMQRLKRSGDMPYAPPHPPTGSLWYYSEYSARPRGCTSTLSALSSFR
jgi:hypothetical protein